MNYRSIIGADIGGTKINIGKIINGKIVSEISLPTKAYRPQLEIIKDITDAIEELFDSSTIGIGIGVPGLVDDKQGIILDIYNIPSWKDLNIKKILESHFNTTVKISNDANCFAIGEKVFGKGNGYSNLVSLTLGTGLGAGIIVNDQICTGVCSIAGELGSINYLDHNYEYYCSGKFFENIFYTNAKSLFDSAVAGNKDALKIFDEFGKHLGNLIKTVLFTYGPEAIFLGGSISKSFQFFHKSMTESVNQFPFKRVIKDLRIDISSNDKLPILGAAALLVSGEAQIKELLEKQIL